MNYKYLFLLIYVFLLPGLFAQDLDYRDYLKTKIKDAKNPILVLKSEKCQNDLQEAIKLDRIGLAFQQINQFDSALIYHQKALKTAQSYSENNEEIGISYNKLGILKFYNGEIDSSAYLLEKALLYLKQPKYRANTLNNLGLMNKRLGQPAIAIEHFLEAIDIYKERKDTMLMIAVSNNIGAMHLALGNYDQALKYHNQALKNAKITNDEFGIAESNMSISAVYSEQKKYERSIPLLEEVLKYFEVTNNAGNLIVCYNNLANDLKDSGASKKAFETYLKTLNLMNASGVVQNKDAILLNVASHFEKEQNFKEALSYGLKALLVAKENKSIIYQEAIYGSIANSYEKLNQLDSSIYYKDRQLNFIDSLDQLEKEKKMLELESKYQNNELSNNLKQTKDELVKKESDVSWFSKSLSVILIILIIVIALTLFIYILYSKKTKQAKKLSERTVKNQQKIGVLSKSINQKEKEILSQRESIVLLPFPEHLTPLTEREKEVLMGVRDGLKDKEIAEQLFISISTVKTHLRRAYVKIDARNRAEAIKFSSKFQL